MKCQACGRSDSMEYNCSRCGRTFCVNHRLPESHDCPGLELQKAQRADRRADGEEVPWFSQEVDLTDPPGRSSSSAIRTVAQIVLVLFILAVIGALAWTLI
ncbi:AN1-type zinc finger domain-containing protein [Halorubrum saccharovorum]|uniref:AN1-type zinc finger domain-containing protein n=1 Tax=Halorubrum saccharovorum TaxID=2248 RepID=UPI0009B5C7B0